MPRFKADDLTTQLRTDGPATPGDENGLASEILLDTLGIEAHLRASEQIKVIHITQRFDIDLAIHYFSHGRQNLVRNPGFFACIGNGTNLLARGLGYGDEYLVHAEPLHDAFQYSQRT